MSTDEEEWQPCLAGDMPLADFNTTPAVFNLVMRKRSCGQWEYREATQQEIDDYLSSSYW
jgi:hypothetical protein